MKFDDESIASFIENHMTVMTVLGIVGLCLFLTLLFGGRPNPTGECMEPCHICGKRYKKEQMYDTRRRYAKCYDCYGKELRGELTNGKASNGTGDKE